MAEKYSSSEIKVLSGMEAVLKRPGMYIGDTEDGSGLHHMLWEIVSNSLDLFMVGKCSQISIILHLDDSVEIIDNGKGIPLKNVEGKTFLEKVMTEFHLTPTYDGHSPHTHAGGLHGVGLAIVNALSSQVEANIFSNGLHYQQKFNNAKPDLMNEIGKTDKSGTSIRLTPNKKYFSNITKFDENLIENRLEELSFLNAGIELNFVGKNKTKKTYKYKKGLVSYLMQMNQLTSKVISTSDECKGVKVDIAFAWSNNHGSMRSFANNLNTKDGGLHVNGMVAGLVQAIHNIKQAAASPKEHEVAIQRNLIAVVHVNIADPAFGAPTKDRLINETAFEAVKNIVYELAVNEFQNDSELIQIFGKIKEN